jgi:hypothetical protein
MKPETVLKDWLHQIVAGARKLRWDDACLYASPEEFVLKEGKPFGQVPLSEEDRKWLLELFRSMRQGYEPKRCFANAQWIVSCVDGFSYWEGYALDAEAPYIPLHHAWNVHNGKVVDVTLRSQASLRDWKKRVGQVTRPDPRTLIERIERNIGNVSYYGVEVPRKFVRIRGSSGRWGTGFMEDLIRAKEKEALSPKRDPAREGDQHPSGRGGAG